MPFQIQLERALWTKPDKETLASAILMIHDLISVSGTVLVLSTFRYYLLCSVWQMYLYVEVICSDLYFSSIYIALLFWVCCNLYVSCVYDFFVFLNKRCRNFQEREAQTYGKLVTLSYIIVRFLWSKSDLVQDILNRKHVGENVCGPTEYGFVTSFLLLKQHRILTPSTSIIEVRYLALHFRQRHDNSIGGHFSGGVALR